MFSPITVIRSDYSLLFLMYITVGPYLSPYLFYSSLNSASVRYFSPIKVSDYYLIRGKARYYLVHFKEAQEDFLMVQKMFPLGMEVQSFMQQYSTDSKEFKNPKKSKNQKYMKHRNSDHKREDQIEVTLDFDSTTNSAFSIESRNSLARVRLSNHQNNHQNDYPVPHSIPSPNILMPLIKSDGGKIKKTQGIALIY